MLSVVKAHIELNKRQKIVKKMNDEYYELIKY